MATEETTYIKARYGIALKILLEKNKKLKKSNDRKGIESKGFDYSYDGISSSTGLRKATISYIMNGKSDIKATTLSAILLALNFSFTQFARIIDKITDDDIVVYLEQSKYKKSKN